MQDNSTIVFNNLSDNQLVSDILKTIVELSRQNDFEIEVKNKTVPETKGELISALIIGVTGSLIADIIINIIKAAVKKYRSRPDFKPDTIIEINKHKTTLKYIADSSNEEIKVFIKINSESIIKELKQK